MAFKFCLTRSPMKGWRMDRMTQESALAKTALSYVEPGMGMRSDTGLGADDPRSAALAGDGRSNRGWEATSALRS